MYKRKTRSFSVVVKLLAIVLLFVWGGSMTADAQDIRAFNGTYSGTATKIIMNGSAKTPQNMSFTLKNGVLTSDVPKIGRMPGRIYFSIAPNRLHANGALTTASRKAGKIRMFGLFSSDLMWDFSTGDKLGPFHGILRNEGGRATLTVTLHCYASMMGKKVKATIVFKGVRK